MIKPTLACLFLIACLPPQAPVITRGPGAQRAAHVTVYVSCDNGIVSAPDKVGSGVIIDQRRVLTAAHVVDCHTIPSVTVELITGERVRMNVVRDLKMFGDGTDLAVLSQFSAFDTPPAVFSRTWWTHDPKLNSRPGQSGTGVYNEQGELVGVVTTTYGIAPIWPNKDKLGL